MDENFKVAATILRQKKFSNDEKMSVIFFATFHTL